MQISVIIPVLNEQPSLSNLHEEISAAAEKHQLDVEVIYVDDGSTDGSWEEICHLAQRDQRVIGLRFRRNWRLPSQRRKTLPSVTLMALCCATYSAL